MKCIIVEDEAPARRALARLCDKVEDLQVVGSCTSGQEASQLLQKEPVDLLFVGSHIHYVQTSEMEGPQPQVIVVTDGHENEGPMVRQATDFLSKPLSIGRLRKAVERVRLRTRLLSPDPSTKEVYIKHQGKLKRLKYEDILFVEATGPSVRVQTTFAAYEVDMSLAEFAEKLEDERFEKVQRSYVVNLSKVQAVGETSLTVANTEISISRASRPMLMTIMKSLK